MAIPAANSNPYFETDASGWFALGGSITRSTVQAHQGVASLLLTPDGVSVQPAAECNSAAGVVPGAVWRAESWVYCSTSRNVSIAINWYTSANAYLSSTSGSFAVTATTWQKITVQGTAPVSAAKASISVFMGSTPAASVLLYLDEAAVRPGISLTATPDPSNDPPRILLDLEYADQTSATIVRTDPNGQQTPVRLAEPATLDGSGQWVGYDYESWFGSSTTYTATTAAGTISSTAVTLNVADIWLRHPGVPSLSLKVDFQGEGEQVVRAVVQAVLQPLGRDTPIVVSDGRRKSKTGVITLRTKTDTEHADLVALFDDVTPLLLDVPPTKQFGADLQHQYLAFGDLSRARLREDYYPHPWRIWTAPYIVVGRPAGGIQSQRTYADVLAGYGTYQAVLTRYSTYTAMLTEA